MNPPPLMIYNLQGVISSRILKILVHVELPKTYLYKIAVDRNLIHALSRDKINVMI